MKRFFFVIILFVAVLGLTAQNNYSPCYINCMKAGNESFDRGEYKAAIKYFKAAKECNDGNPDAAQKRINECNARINAMKNAEARRKMEEEAAKEEERRIKEENERKAQEEAARKIETRKREDAENLRLGNENFSKGLYVTAKLSYERVEEYGLSEAKEKIKECDRRIREQIRQQEYSENMKLGDKAFKYDRYVEAREYYRKAMAYNSEVQVRVAECDQRIEEEKALQQVLDTKRCPSVPSVTDYDGNTYRTVMIGAQCWMAENLRTTHYADGTSIPLGSSVSETNAFRYVPERDASLVPQYGYLYNWHAVMNGATSSSTNPSGVQGICPEGWHVPSLMEWGQIKNYFFGKGGFYRYIRSSYSYSMVELFDSKGWEKKSFATDSLCNVSGFSALPAGGFFDYGTRNFRESAYFWTTTRNYSRALCYTNIDFVELNGGTYRALSEIEINGKRLDNFIYGFSVRCVYDSEFLDKINEKNCGTVTDYDGNTYQTVQIGSQCWMRENLRTTHYADGSIIKRYEEKKTDGGRIYKLTAAPRYFPFSTMQKEYGLLYNYHAAVGKAFGKKNAPPAVQGVCPDGWHIPNLEDWEQLETYAESQDDWMLYDDGSKLGRRGFAKAFAMNDSLWKGTSGASVPGAYVRLNNVSGFSAYPVGEFDPKGNKNFGSTFRMWIYNPLANSDRYKHYKFIRINYDNISVHMGTGSYVYLNGMAVRCVRD